MHTHIETDKNAVVSSHPEVNRHLVKITVDGNPHRVREGIYIVSKFKELVGVDADKELDVIEHGELRPLCDTDKIHVKEGMVFVSHVRTGCSS